MDESTRKPWRDWPNYTEHKLSKAFEGLKRKRVQLFIDKLGLGPDDIVLDLGSEDGGYLAKYYPYPHNIVIADIFEEPMRRGVKKHGLNGYRLIEPDAALPFDDREFKAVWCNSVVEHVTLPRAKLATASHMEFVTHADEHQLFFASEIRRIARSYFVQTPNKHFPVESHSVLPFVAYLRHPTRYRASQALKSFWIKQWTADFHLYDKARFQSHYPDATEIIYEEAMLMTKSLIALRYND